MKIDKKGAIFVLVALSFLIPLASAEVLISQPESLYNVGDPFNLEITVKPQSYAAGYLVSKLVCPSNEIELYRSPISVEPENEKKIEISMNLDNFLVSGMEGQCHVTAQFADDSFSTPKFELSRKISVTMNLNGPVYNPGETVSVSGEAKKENGESLSGFVEIIVADIDLTHTATVNSGPFNFSFKIPSDAPAGSYKVDVRAYEKDSFEDIINEGTATSVIRINQVIEKSEIAFKEQTINPTQDLSYTINLYDQAGDSASKDISVEIYNIEGELYKKQIVRSGEQQTLKLESSSSPGYWTIKAKYEEITSERDFLVEEHPDLSFKLENETLVVENIGNVQYSGPVEITIGDKNEVLEITKLAIGETKKFRLRAPDGEYTIGVRRGTDEKNNLGTAPLTGNAVSVDDVNDSLGGNLYILLGLLLVLIVAIIFVLVYKKYRKGSMLGNSSKPSSENNEQKALEKGAAATLIDKGEKQETSIIALSLKNIAEIKSNPEALKSIDSALWKAKESGAKVYTDEAYRIAIFAPILTKEKDNTIRAASVAQTMERILQAHNKHSASKIDYGMSIHTGNLIVEKKD
ncbi:MAG: hypothetical protein KC506_03360 [Nanoarchaeota archaeon]|nr:hypothetical protein [Nanoarchaeota archaeon]